MNPRTEPGGRGARGARRPKEIEARHSRGAMARRSNAARRDASAARRREGIRSQPLSGPPGDGELALTAVGRSVHALPPMPADTGGPSGVDALQTLLATARGLVTDLTT